MLTLRLLFTAFGVICCASLVACAGDDDVDWRAEFVDLSQSEYASRLYYQEPLDKDTVGAIGLQQCGVMTRVLTQRGTETARIMNDLQLSMDGQLQADVPAEVIRRDLAALDAAMLEFCEPEHRALLDYLHVENFSDLPDCTFVEWEAPAAAIAAACATD